MVLWHNYSLGCTARIGTTAATTICDTIQNSTAKRHGAVIGSKGVLQEGGGGMQETHTKNINNM
jgi:hypothetical protein